MNELQLFTVLFLCPVLFLTAVYLLAKNRQKLPRISALFFGLLIGGLGIFALVYTYNLFSQYQAILPLKMAAPFKKADHPVMFIVCVILNISLGLTLLWFAVHTFFRGLWKNRHVAHDFQP